MQKAGKQEPERLAGPRFGDGDDVTALKGDRPGLGLDGGRLGETGAGELGTKVVG